MSDLVWWHQLTLHESLCPQCEAIRWLEDLDADPANRYGFTWGQQQRIYAALGVLDNPNDFWGAVVDRADGETVMLHRCGRVLDIPPYWASRMRSARAEWEKNPASRVTDHVEGVH